MYFKCRRQMRQGTLVLGDFIKFYFLKMFIFRNVVINTFTQLKSHTWICHLTYERFKPPTHYQKFWINPFWILKHYNKQAVGMAYRLLQRLASTDDIFSKLEKDFVAWLWDNVPNDLGANSQDNCWLDLKKRHFLIFFLINLKIVIDFSIQKSFLHEAFCISYLYGQIFKNDRSKEQWCLRSIC